MRALLNQPFNEKWDSTIGASVTKTSTNDWKQGKVNASDFNHVAARVFNKLKKEGEENFAKQRKLALREARVITISYKPEFF